jgi:hypothetical protein
MVVCDAKKAAPVTKGKAACIGCGSERFAPATPPQLSPMKPRRQAAPAHTAQLQPDVASLSGELGRLLQHSSGAPSARAAADWESLPVNVWDVVWRGHLDLPAQMALCLTNTRHAALAAGAIRTRAAMRVSADAPAGVPLHRLDHRAASLQP